MRRSRLMRVLLVGLIGSLLLVTGVAQAPVASAAESRRDTASYNGSLSSINFIENSLGGGYFELDSVWAGLVLPSGYAGFCAYAKLLRNGYEVQRTGTYCDGDHNAHIRFYFTPETCRSGSVMSVWFSDPVTRYAVTHPALIC